MRIRALVAAALLVGLPALPASAGDDSFHTGDCGYSSIAQETLTGSQDRFEGVADALVTLRSRTHGNAVAGVVTCELRVNGVPVFRASAAGVGVVAFTAPISFTAGDVDHVTMCVLVDFTSDSTPSAETCQGATTTEMDPMKPVRQAERLAGYPLLEWVFYSFTVLDTVTCTAFHAAAGNEAGPVTIADDGDVFLAGEWFWDCPPYDESGGGEPAPQPPMPGGPSGAGWDDGGAGFLTLVSPETTTLPAPGDGPADYAVTSTCAFRTDPVTGQASIAGVTAALDGTAPDETRVHCSLEDAATGATVYDDADTNGGATVTLTGTAVATGPLNVCTEGSATWGARTVTVGRYCRLAS